MHFLLLDYSALLRPHCGALVKSRTEDFAKVRGSNVGQRDRYLRTDRRCCRKCTAGLAPSTIAAGTTIITASIAVQLPCPPEHPGDRRPLVIARPPGQLLHALHGLCVQLRNPASPHGAVRVPGGDDGSAVNSPEIGLTNHTRVFPPQVHTNEVQSSSSKTAEHPAGCLCRTHRKSSPSRNSPTGRLALHPPEHALDEQLELLGTLSGTFAAAAALLDLIRHQPS